MGRGFSRRLKGFRKSGFMAISGFALVSFLSQPVKADSPIPLGDDVRLYIDPREPQRSLVASTGNYRIDGLRSGYKLDPDSLGRITFSFYSSAVFNGTYYGSETGVSEVSAEVKQNVRQIMGHLSKIVAVDFVEVTETASSWGQIRIMLSNTPSYAYAYYPSSNSFTSISSDIHLNTYYDNSTTTNGFRGLPGTHGYMSLIHEIGHALGLKHPHDGSPNLPHGEDNTSTTVMTYNFTGNSAGLPMPFDIEALTHFYGKSSRTALTGRTSHTT